MSRVPRQNHPFQYVVEHCLAGQWTPGDRDAMIIQQAHLDAEKYGGREKVVILLEQEPGSGGLAQNYELRKKLTGFPVESIPVRGERSAIVSHLSSKVIRHGPFASAAQIGDVALIAGEWNEAWLDEEHNFPDGMYSDRVDASSLAFNWLSEKEVWDIGIDGQEARNCECGRIPHEDWCDEGFTERQEAQQEFNRRNAGDLYRGDV